MREPYPSKLYKYSFVFDIDYTIKDQLLIYLFLFIVNTLIYFPIFMVL